MDINILKPYPESLIINKGEFQIEEFTLNIITGIIKHYGDLKHFEECIKPQGKITSEILKTFSDAVSTIAWLLLKDKNYFKSFNVFKSQFLPIQKGKTPTKGELEKLEEFKENQRTIDLVVERSKPIIKKEDSINHLGKETVESKLKAEKSDYGELYIYLATKIYSLDLEKFINLTLRQIHKFTSDLEKLEHKSFIQNCRLHGISMEDNKPTKFTKKENDKFKKTANQMYTNLMKGFKR